MLYSNTVAYNWCSKCGRPLYDGLYIIEPDGSAVCFECVEKKAAEEPVISLLEKILEELRLIRMKRNW